MYTRNTDINGVKIRENIRDLSAIRGKKLKKETHHGYHGNTRS